MKKQFDPTNRGILFPNDKKESLKQPDFRGSINIEGIDYWLSGWSREDGSISLSRGDKKDRLPHSKPVQQKMPLRQPAQIDPNLNDEIPF